MIVLKIIYSVDNKLYIILQKGFVQLGILKNGFVKTDEKTNV